jgi:hypothetical protein
MIHIVKGLLGKTRNEKGAVLVLTLLMLAITLTIIPALVSVMITGAKTGVMYDQKNNELYSADAGVQDAVNRIKNLKVEDIPENPLDYEDYFNSMEEYSHDINGKIAQVTITTVEKFTGEPILYFKIFSQGQSPSGEETTITAYVNAFGGWVFSDRAYTSPSPEELTLHSGDLIHGGAQVPGGWNGKGTLEDPDEPNYDAVMGWPSASFFAEHYFNQVDVGDDFIPGGTTITVPKNSQLTLGAIYCDGDLTIDFEGGDTRLTLAGTWYVKGKLTINKPNAHGQATLDLNDQAIFVEKAYEKNEFAFDQNTLAGKAQVSISGPGVIVAVGNIKFKPEANTEDDPIYIMSIEGSVDMWPDGDFYGSISSYLASKIQPNTSIFWPKDFDWGSLNLPTESEYDFIIGDIESWEIDNPFTGIKIGPYVLPSAEVDIDYPQALEASGGTAPYTWEKFTFSTLPPGLTLNADGTFYGIPAVAGKYYFSVQAVDQSGEVGKQVVAITVKPQPIITTNLPGGTVGEPYDGRLIVQGGVPSYEWTITSGSLPDGLDLNSTSGQISGIPTTPGTSIFQVTLKDYYGVTKSLVTSISISIP